MGDASAGGREDLKPLTSLRFVAALMVFAHHAFPIAMIYELGPDGVAFFFLLSGFILTYTYHPHFSAAVTWDKVRSFYLARLARIYPLQLATLGIAALTMTALHGPSWGGLEPKTQLLWALDGVLLLQAWVPSGLTDAINPPAWSISVEAFFYVFFPLAAWYLIRSLRGSGQRFALGVAGALWIVYVMMCLRLPRADLWAFYAFPPLRLIDFLVGMLLGIAFLRQRAFIRGTYVELCAIALIAIGIVVSHHAPPGLTYSAALMPLWSFVILTFARGTGLISRALSKPFAVRLGEISFAFYLVHLTVLEAVGCIGLPHPLMIAISLVLTIGLAFALFYRVESPMRHWIRRIAARSRTRDRECDGEGALSPSAAGSSMQSTTM
jgi:peptidoglycan/LPS O-acetylase OafA/YrhL